MDELDILKKDWNSQKETFKSYSNSDIYGMLHKKSSSIVKTLFYISLAELVFWIFMSAGLPYVMSDNFNEKLKESYEDPIFIVLNILSYVIIFLFIYLLFKSYRSISTTDSARRLMKNILKTRKVIKYYVLFNLTMIFVSMPLSMYFEYEQNPEFHAQLVNAGTKEMLVIIGLTILVTGVIVVLLWLFYRLIYGILLKRLNRNYEELKRLEV